MNNDWNQQSFGAIDQVAHHQAKNKGECNADHSGRKSALIMQKTKPDRLKQDCPPEANLL